MTATTAAEATRALAAQPLPPQPPAVREWLQEQRRADNAAVRLLNGTVRAALAGVPTAALVDPEEITALMARALAPMPAEIRAAYDAWATAYNKIVDARNAERQARINGRETAKVRAQACPRCFTTHPGEC
jgi:hypothetical protein